MSSTCSNQDAFGGYRHVVKNGAKDYRSGRFQGSILVALIGAQTGLPLPFATGAGGAIPDHCAVALATWLFRYVRRRDTIHGGGAYGQPLIDTVARDVCSLTACIKCSSVSLLGSRHHSVLPEYSAHCWSA